MTAPLPTREAGLSRALRKVGTIRVRRWLAVLVVWLAATSLAVVSAPASVASGSTAGKRATTGAPPGGGGDAPDRVRPLADEVRAIWVVRTSLAGPGQPGRIVRAAKELGANTLLVQVVGRGDAWYDSDLLPRAEGLPADAGDPLHAIVTEAHAAGLSVQAWVNVALVWSSPDPPVDPRHVVHAHPEWIMQLPGGRSFAEVPMDSLHAWWVEGLFAETSHPGYRRHLRRVVGELLAGYDLDGIHLDYVRRPILDGGYDPVTLEAFLGPAREPRARLLPAWQEGLDPVRHRWPDYSDRVESPGHRAWNRRRRDAVTAAVREIRAEVDLARSRDGRERLLTAAVIPEPDRARRRFAQDWPAWIEEGLLDAAILMCYARGREASTGQLAAALAEAPADRVVAGIGVWHQPLGEAAISLRRALSLAPRGVSIFSYGALEETGFPRPDLLRRGWWPAWGLGPARVRDRLAVRDPG